MPSHYEESLQRDIDRIRGKVAEMEQLATQALEACLRALVERNRQTAYTVILRDRRIDELEKEVDRLCLEFIVRQQPVGRHLRFAYITIKVNQELERIGDYAESIARQVIKLSSIDCTLPLDRYRQIAQMVIPMLQDSVKSYVTGDVELARRTREVEEPVDGLKGIINAEIFQLRQDNRIPLEALTPLMTIARRFERVSDQASNICEEVIYMVTGEYQKHIGGEVWRMVFLDDHNACRSQMAEAIANSLAQPQFVFASAGLDPKPVDPGTVAFLRDKQIDPGHVVSRSVDQVPNLEFAQVIVALSTEARRAFPKGSKAVCLDWSLEDPSLVQGTPQQKHEAYQKAYNFLHEHISELCEAVAGDRID